MLASDAYSPAVIKRGVGKFACEEVLPHRHQLLPPAAQMDDASWDKLFTTATLTDYQAEDVVRALPGSGWGRDGACVSLPRLGVL